MGTQSLAIKAATWTSLVNANITAVQSGWAQPGVFATAVGPAYQCGAGNSLLYVGKSAGPLGDRVGSVQDQRESAAASTRWMVQRINKSAFWQLVEAWHPTRKALAWTNICKMDRLSGDRPPNGREWAGIMEVCIQALSEEIDFLVPNIIVFATSNDYRFDLDRLLEEKKYSREKQKFDDGWTRTFRNSLGQVAIHTKHPQGWPADQRDQLAMYVNSFLRN